MANRRTVATRRQDAVGVYRQASWVPYRRRPTPATKFVPTITPTPIDQPVNVGLPELSEGYFCGPEATYNVEVDWNNDGVYDDPYDNVSTDLLQRVQIQTAYGRDDARALLPIAAGEMRFELCDTTGLYDENNSTSPLVGDVKPGRAARLRVTETRTGLDFYLFNGFIDAISTKWNRVYSTVPITATDGLASKLQGVAISTEIYQAVKTGEAIDIVLDEIGWPALKRSIDEGSTMLPWFWAEGASALQTIQRIVACEGPPSLVYIDPETGNFVFEDRHHRLLRTRSQESQATFCVNYRGCQNAIDPPSIRDTETTTGNSVPSLTVNTPTAVEGDRLIAFQFAVRGGSLGAMTAPDGFDQAGVDHTVTDGSFSLFGKIWTKNVDGSESATYDFNFSASSQGSGVILTSVQNPGDTITPVWGGVASVTTAMIAPEITASDDETLMLSAWTALTFGNATTFLPPTDMVEIADSQPGGMQIAVSAASESLAVAGASGTKTATSSWPLYYLSVSLGIAPSAGTCPEGSYSYMDPFEYRNTRQNIINHSKFTVTNYRVSGDFESLWSTDITLNLADGETVDVPVKASAPFLDAFVSFTWTPSDTTDVITSLSRTSGESTIMTLTASGGDLSILKLGLSGRPLEVLNEVDIEAENASSIAEFDLSSYAPDAPWINFNDARDIADGVVARWGQRNPIVRLHVANCDRDPDQLSQILSLVIGDRITIVNRLINLAEDFIIERIERTITGRGKLHEVVFSCEQAFDLDDPDTVFRFDTAGQGFDDGLFGH